MVFRCGLRLKLRLKFDVVCVLCLVVWNSVVMFGCMWLLWMCCSFCVISMWLLLLSCMMLVMVLSVMRLSRLLRCGLVFLFVNVLWWCSLVCSVSSM